MRIAQRRLVGLAVVFLLMFAAVVVRLGQVQVLHPDRFVSQGERQRFVSNVIPAGRGTILDRNGVELALSLPQKSVFADPELIAERGDVTRTADVLAPILGLDRTALLADISGEGRFVLLAHTVPDAVAEQVADADLPGVGMFDEYKRFRPSGDVGQSILGQVSKDGSQGSGGIEEQYDALLDGRPGQISYERRGQRGAGEDGKGTTIAGGRQKVQPARPGSDLKLTIDRALQYQTEQVLGQHVAAVGAKGGIAIITDPQSGEVLAMANVSTGEDGSVKPTTNNLALTTVFEPGSVTKVITVASAMDAGLINPTTPIEVPWQYQVADHTFSDHDPHPTQTWTPTDILVSSSNVGTIKIGQMLGRDRLDAALREFGLGSATGLDFPWESRGLMLDPENWSGTSIGAIPIGQGISVTALQMLEAFNVIANDGVYVAPQLVASTIDTAGRERDAEPASRRRVVSETTATQLRSILAQVVTADTGTGGKAQVPGYTVAGKTGTARKPVTPHMPGDGYMDMAGNYHYVATFAGFVPAENPQLSLIVVIDEPTSSIYASDVSAPVFAELARYALRRYGVPPSVVAGRDEAVPEVSDSAREAGDTIVPGSGQDPAVGTDGDTTDEDTTDGDTTGDGSGDDGDGSTDGADGTGTSET